MKSYISAEISLFATWPCFTHKRLIPYQRPMDTCFDEDIYHDSPQAHLMHRGNWPFEPESLLLTIINRIGHFRDTVCLCFKAIPRVKRFK